MLRRISRVVIISVLTTVFLVGFSLWAGAQEEYEWERCNLEDWTITTKYMKKPPYTIGVATAFMGRAWMGIYMEEIREEVKGYGDMIKQLIHVDAGGDIRTQIANIKDLMAKKVDAIIIDPQSPSALVPVVEEAYKKGIVVVVNKNPINTDKYVAFQNNDEVLFGAQSAEWLVDQLGGKGLVLCLRGVPGYGVELERWAGAKSVFDKYPEIKLVTEYGYWAYDKGKEVSKSMIAAHPRFDGIWSMGGQMSRGMVDVLVEAGYDVSKYPHASEDQNGFVKQAVEYGFPAYVSAKPVWQGRLAVRTAMDALRGLPVIKKQVIPSPGYGPEYLDKVVRPELPDLAWLTTTLSDKVLKELFKGG